MSVHSQMDGDSLNRQEVLPKNALKTQEDEAQHKQRSIIIPILKTFICMCSTPEFHWNLHKYNAIELLTRMREKDDERINEVAKEVCEKVIDHIDDSMLVAE